MSKSLKASAKTYDVVENAIELSKQLRGTWEQLIRKRNLRVRPWAAETGNNNVPAEEPQRSQTEESSDYQTEVHP